VTDLPDALLAAHHVLVSTDNAFQRRARLLQALWRESRNFPLGERASGLPLGSRLPRDFAEETGANLITLAARNIARREVAAMRAGSGQKIDEGRLWSNLLSSQPLVFNVFATLATDLELATRIFSQLWPERVAAVTRVEFEYSPGRSSAQFTGDRTAFDAYLEHTTPSGGRGFVGVEVKYHEALTDQPAAHRPRYDELTRAMGCFKPESFRALGQKPVEQLWRDHMLAGAMLLDRSANWDTGLYVFLYPEGNAACHRAVQSYGSHLSDTRSFCPLTLEALVTTLESVAESAWTLELRERYLDWQKVDFALGLS
jgi:hypothetical protein